MAETPPVWFAGITAADFPEQYRPLADLIGVEAAVKVMAHLAGGEYYFPKMDGPAGFMEVRNRWLRERWRKHNAKQLAQEAGLTINELRLIVRDHEAQIDLLPVPAAK